MSNKPPIQVMLDAVEWKLLPPGEPGDIPHATHEGVLEIGGVPLRCYQLSNGERVFNYEDVHRFFGVEP